MPAKKSKGTVTKKRPSHGKAAKKPSKANKTKRKASKRKSQAKKRQDKYRKKQRKERKRADKAKRTARKTGTKKTKKSKDKKKKKEPKKKKASEAGKQQAQSDEEDDGENEGKVEMRFNGMTVNQMQNLRQQVVELSKDEFLEQIKETAENHSEEARLQSALMGTAESRMKLFQDSEKPTDGSKGPFQSNRFGAVFLLPGQ